MKICEQILCPKKGLCEYHSNLFIMNKNVNYTVEIVKRKTIVVLNKRNFTVTNTFNIMKTDWSNQDVARLKFLIQENGKAKGIHIYANESGRSENSIRIKLSRINKEKVINDAENAAYEQLSDEEENARTASWFSRIIDFFSKMW